MPALFVAATLILAILPVVVTMVTILAFRWPILRASVAGCLVAVLTVALPTPFHLPITHILPGLAPGALGALHVVYVLLTGAVLYQVMNAAGSLTRLVEPVTRVARTDLERALLISGALGPFFESATGFGVGVLMAAPLYRALGFDTARTVWLSLLTQSAVPWGAMAAGTTVNAQLSGVSLAALGRTSAVLSLPILLGYMLLIARIASGRDAVRRQLDLVLLTWAILSAALYGANLVLPTVIAGVVAGLVTAGLLLALLRMRGRAEVQSRDLAMESPPAGRGATLRAWMPYAVLLAWALLADTVHPLHAVLNRVAWRVPSFHFTISWLTEPGFSLFLAALTCVTVYRLSPRTAASAVGRGLRQMVPAAGSTILLMGMATLMEHAGMTDALGRAAAHAPAWLYVALVPVLGGLGGYLSGSNSAGNAMFVPLHVAAAARLHLPVPHLSALQNVAASNLTMDGPARLAMAVAAAGEQGREARYAGPAVVLGVGVIAAVALEGLLWLALR